MVQLVRAVGPRLRLLPCAVYPLPQASDPLRFYYWPVLGTMYRRRVELCLAECSGGRRVLEVGYGSGLTFLNLHKIYDEIYGLDCHANPEEVAACFRARGVETHLQRGNVLNMPYPDDCFDTVLLISILEHIRPVQLELACREIRRVLKPGGQMICGVPVERPLMVFLFHMLGCNIREHHFSSHDEVSRAASAVLKKIQIVPMRSTPPGFGTIYEVGHFVK